MYTIKVLKIIHHRSRPRRHRPPPQLVLHLATLVAKKSRRINELLDERRDALTHHGATARIRAVPEDLSFHLGCGRRVTMFNPPWEGSQGPSCSTVRLQFMYSPRFCSHPPRTCWGKLSWAHRLISAAQTLFKSRDPAQNEAHLHKIGGSTLIARA